MRVLLALLVLNLFIPLAQADWTLIGRTDRFDSYADGATRRPLGNSVRMWVLSDYKAPETNPSGRQFLSEKLLFEYDCVSDTFQLIAYVEYAGRMGTGATVGSGDSPGVRRNVVPGSIGQSRWRVACESASSPRIAGAAGSQSADFDLINRSSEAILGLYVSATNAASWGADLLGNSVLRPGQRFSVTLPRGECIYDVRVWYPNDRAEDRMAQNLCSLTDMTFDGSGARTFAQTGQASPPRQAAVPVRPPASAPASDTPRQSFGTGFFINSQGLALTNQHVIDGCRSITVKHEGRDLSAQVMRSDSRNDLALLRVQAQSVPFATFRAGAGVRPGEAVLVAGFPLPTVLQNGVNVTVGNVSALAGLGGNTAYLQITAPVQPGNSGGPLLDMAGNLIGVIVSKLNAAAVAQATGDIPQNINFAVQGLVARLFVESGGQKIEERSSVKELRVGDVSDRARSFTFQIECRP